MPLPVRWIAVTADIVMVLWFVVVSFALQQFNPLTPTVALWVQL